MFSSAVFKKITAAALVITIAAAGAETIGFVPHPGVTAKALAGDMSLSDMFCYQENEDGTLAVSEIISENSHTDEITVPEEYDGREVTVIQSAPMNKWHAELSSQAYSLYIGKNIRDIQPQAFEGIRISEINVDINNQSFTVKDGMLFTKDLSTLIFCPDSAEGMIKVPSKTISVREDAFRSSEIESVFLGAGVSDITGDTFSRCEGLEYFGVNSSNPYFKASGGMLLTKDGSTVVAYPRAKSDACTLPSKVTAIGDRAFYGSNISRLDLSKVRRIGDYSFAGSSKLKSVNIYNSEYIGDGAFSNCTSLTSVSIEDGISRIPAELFADCTSLGTVNLPSSVISVGIGSLDNTKWFNDQADGFIYIGGILYGSKGNVNTIRTLDIKEGTFAVADGALRGTNVRKLIIPSTLRYMTASSLFPAEDLRFFSVSKDNPWFTSVNNFVFSKDMQKLVCVPYSGTSEECSLPVTVKEIGDLAFAYNKTIKKIYLSNNVIKFGVSPFNNGEADRTVVCLENSPAAAAALEDDVSIIFMETSISMNAQEMTMGVSENRTLQVSVRPDLADNNVIWSSSDPDVVSVKDGKLTANAEGTAVITASESTGKTAQCKVTVKEEPSGVLLSSGSVTLGYCESWYLTARTPDGDDLFGVTYTSSDPSVASVSIVDEKCRISSHKTGTAVVTAKSYNGKTASCNVTVKEAPKSISFNKTGITIGVGERATISSAVNAGAASSARTYVSSDSDIVQIVPSSWDCTFVGLSEGTAEITVRTYDGKSAKCKVVVKAPPVFVSMEKSSINIGIGEKASLGLSLDSTQGCAERLYESSNEAIVKMYKKDWISGFEGVKAGSAKVTVKTYNDQKASCTINVKPAPSEITLNTYSVTMKVGETKELVSTIPSGSAAFNRTWTSSNTSIVKINSMGKLGNFTALKAGTCYVTVRTFNGKEAMCKVVVK